MISKNRWGIGRTAGPRDPDFLQAELRAAETGLALAKMRLEALVESSPAAVVVLDPQSRVRLWSPAAAKLTGYAAEEVMGKACPLVFPASSGNDPGVTAVSEGIYRAKDGSKISLSSTAVPLYGESAFVTEIMVVAMPLQEPARGQVASFSEPDRAPSGRGEAILVVEDNAELRRVVTAQLQGLDYEVLEAENGASALQVMNTHAIDLLFSDVVMPGGLSGFDIAKHAHMRYPNLAILLTSGFPGNTPGERREIAPGFAVELLGKPYRKNELARKIRETLDAAPKAKEVLHA